MKTLQISPEEGSAAGPDREMALPGDTGKGVVRMISLNSGIRLSLSDYSLNAVTRMEYRAFPAVLGFGFCLSGSIESQPAGFRQPQSIRPGQCGLFHFHGESMRETVGKDAVLRVNLMLDPEKIRELMERDPQWEIPALRRLLDRPGRLFANLTPAMRAILLQMRACPYEGMIRSLFMESKAMELMAHKLDQLGEEDRSFQGKCGPKKEEMERTLHAGEILLRDLENPPSISEVARQAGMCRSRLHRCFREVFGMTPFDYLRHQRLETAGRLLRQGEMNVTEAAGAVGYASLSHFTKAFRRHTGHLPCQYRQGRVFPAENARRPKPQEVSGGRTDEEDT